MIVKKQLSTFFGTVPVGLLSVKNFPFFFVFIVLLVVNGPNVSYIVVGLNVIVIMESPYSIIWILLILFRILLLIPIKCFLKFSSHVMPHLRCFAPLPKLLQILSPPLPHPTLSIPPQPHLYSRQRMFHPFHLCTAPVNTTI